MTFRGSTHATARSSASVIIIIIIIIRWASAGGWHEHME